MFYSRLLQGDTVRQAFERASTLVKVKQSKPSEFILLPKDAAHDETIFPQHNPASPMDASESELYVEETSIAPLHFGFKSTSSHYFVGRHKQLQQAFQHFNKKQRCITFTGIEGD
jgi:hypothetical protein